MAYVGLITLGVTIAGGIIGCTCCCIKGKCCCQDNAQHNPTQARNTAKDQSTQTSTQPQPDQTSEV